jgi:hypothetical protein
LETGQDEDEHEGQYEDDFVIINFEEKFCKKWLKLT